MFVKHLIHVLSNSNFGHGEYAIDKQLEVWALASNYQYVESEKENKYGPSVDSETSALLSYKEVHIETPMIAHRRLSG